VYASTEGKEEESITFYETLQKIINRVPKNDFFVLMGDLNAQVGNSRLGNYRGRHGENIINKNGDKLLDFVSYNHLKIMNTFFEHKDSHQYTWSAREQKSIIDYIITNEKLSLIILDTRVYRSFEIESHHYMLVSPARLQPK
jgi:exonuclease III